jgi:hypothetical protein
MQMSDQIKSAVNKEEARAAKALAEAFAVIEEHRDYLPEQFYRDFADHVTWWASESNWTSDPKLMRQVLPILLHAVIEQEDEE